MTRRALHDWHVVAVAAATCLGALWAHAFSLPWRVAAAVALAGGIARGRLAPLGIGALVTASALAASSWAGLDPPPPWVLSDQWVTLITDPAPFASGSVGFEARLGRRHVQAWARGPAATALSPRLAGERVQVSGVLRPLSPVAARRYAPRHLSGRVSVDAVGETRAAAPLGRVANAYRRLVTRGAEALPERTRPLFGGMVMGDDRGQPPELSEAFKAAGLTHLLAVSGQNVAFVLLLAVPLLRRGRLRWRLAVTVAVLLGFGVLTRWEPSVMRAEAMAVVAAVGAFAGRPVRGVRLLALAVAGCVLVDPLLVHSLGFRLSVAACSGLVVLTSWLAARLPLVLAASIAAQAGASVVLIPTFGGVPLAGLPANVLAVPAAGPIMMWGLVAGPLAGAIPFAAPLLHLPTRLALAWVAGVAEVAARLPLAPVGALGGALFLLAVLALARRAGAPAVRALAAATVLGVVLVSARPAATSTGDVVAAGARLWVRGPDRVLVVHNARPGPTIAALRTRNVHYVDVLVSADAGRAAADQVWPLVRALRPSLVIAPEHHQLAPARTVRTGAVATAGDLVVEVTAGGPPLRVTVSRRQSSPSHSRSAWSHASLRASNCSFQCAAASADGYGPSWRSRGHPPLAGSTRLWSRHQ